MDNGIKLYSKVFALPLLHLTNQMSTNQKLHSSLRSPASTSFAKAKKWTIIALQFVRFLPVICGFIFLQLRPVEVSSKVTGAQMASGYQKDFQL